MNEFQRYSCYTVKQLQQKAARLKEALRHLPQGSSRYVRHQKELIKVLRAIERKSHEPYTTRAIRFIRSIIKERKRLVNSGESRKNEALMRKEMTRLEDHIEAWEWKPKTMAGFFMHNAATIYMMIPMPPTGETKHHRDFYNLKNEALNIKKQEAVCQQS